MTTFERIKKVANERGYSLKKLAIDAGFSENALYRYNQGVEPKYSTVAALANVLGVSVDYLLGNTDEMHSNKKDDKSEIDLDKALADQGVVMRYQGKELSDKAKRGILEILKLVDGDED
jgi:Predicted transcriptional regulator